MPIQIPGAALSVANAATARAQVQASSTADVVGSFSQALSKAMKDIGDSQIRADDMIQKLQTGSVQDVHEVMAAVEEAGLSMQLALQLRSKALDAYQEIMRMQV